YRKENVLCCSFFFWSPCNILFSCFGSSLFFVVHFVVDAGGGINTVVVEKYSSSGSIMF
ncbi:unnamed protein product, partial [Heterosigma akashiwo]